MVDHGGVETQYSAYFICKGKSGRSIVRIRSVHPVQTFSVMMKKLVTRMIIKIVCANYLYKMNENDGNVEKAVLKVPERMHWLRRTIEAYSQGLPRKEHMQREST